MSINLYYIINDLIHFSPNLTVVNSVESGVHTLPCPFIHHSLSVLITFPHLWHSIIWFFILSSLEPVSISTAPTTCNTQQPARVVNFIHDLPTHHVTQPVLPLIVGLCSESIWMEWTLGCAQFSLTAVTVEYIVDGGIHRDG